MRITRPETDSKGPYSTERGINGVIKARKDHLEAQPGRVSDRGKMENHGRCGSRSRSQNARTPLMQEQESAFVCSFFLKKKKFWGAWVAQSVERPTSTQVMISRSVSSSPVSGSVLMAQSLEPASDSVSPSLSAPAPCSRSFWLSKINKKH